jgi:NAD(P)-dependent dehydrogenase (short-subunit alcohol dehydrogenase family)
MSRNILVTGAAYGLGKAITELFAQQGDVVFATDNESVVKQVYQEKKTIYPFIMDVSSEASIKEICDKISGYSNTIDVLINNAGISEFYPLLEAGEERIQRSFQINTFGPYRVTKTFFPLLLKAKGRVINISSEVVKLPTFFQPYPASKAAMEALMKSIGQELYLKGIQSTFIRPGAIKTRLLDQLHSIQKEKNHSLFEKEFNSFIVEAPKREGNPVSAEKVALKIWRIAGKRRLKPVYRINNNPLLHLIPLLPYRLVVNRMKKMVQK